MYPILIDTPYLFLPAWHAFYVLGAIGALFLLRFLGARWYPDTPQRRLNQLFITCYISGYFGARLLSILIEDDLSQGLGFVLTSLFQLGSMTFYGGFIGGVVGGWILTGYMRMNRAQIWDLSLPCLMVALAFGRIGCFLNGDDYGVPVSLLEDGTVPWYGVVFPNLQDGVARVPSQLVETGFALLITFAMLRFGDSHLRKRGDAGYVGLLGLIMYSVYRFFAEYLRADYRGWIVREVLSPSQLISIVILVVASVWWMLHRSHIKQAR